ncbi:MAG TPA: RecQ family ATP-dependent DNA helicase [Microthrixaceae bacterium]|nr:RecQ family ATP-dependent DNA helicase [Microthrixaceae bacterium]
MTRAMMTAWHHDPRTTGQILVVELRNDDLADKHLDLVLRSMAGPEAVARDDQRAAVRALVADRSRVLVVQATGWGKSAVYWAATSAIRSVGDGPTLVVSPLLALMRDQIKAAETAGLTASTINSTNVDDWDAVMRDIQLGSIDVLLVSPERLANPSFAHRIGPIIERAGLVVIDEAHCISDWGFDFRPDYQRLSKVLTASTSTPVLATTATANQRVTTDVAQQLGSATVVLRGSLARSSLRLSVLPGLGPLERYAWVVDALELLPGSGIVYVPTVADTERLASFLISRGQLAAAYSGRVESADRERIEDELRANRLKVVVATSALGMGYDKPDLGFCVHVGSPDSPVAYYQQVGRAGRAIDRAEAVLLPAETDERLWAYFATASIPLSRDIDKVLETLREAGESMSLIALESATGLRRGRLESLLKVIAVEGAVERDGGSWAATGTPYVYDEPKWDGIRKARAAEADLMRSYAGGRGCLMEFLQRSLDDPDPGPCGRCSVCTGELPAQGRKISPETIEAARSFVRGIDVVIEPRKMWPSRLSDGRKGRIAGATTGRALTFADTPGWPTAASAAAGPDGPLADEIINGIVAVLGRWRTTWDQRPVAIVPIPSRRHGTMIRHLAESIGQIGKLPVIELLETVGPPPPEGVPSGPKVEALLSGLRLVESAAVPKNGPLLLIDETYRSGWTMTVAAAILRDAGARAVMPLVVHQLP